MKKHIFFLLALLSLFCSSCSDDTPQPAPQQLAVNYANISGHWQLVDFGGHSPADGTYVYLTFERRDHVFQMYDNLQSMYGQKRTGAYFLYEDERTETTILSGSYDNGVGEWSHEYTVTSLTENELRLTMTDTPHETTTYRRLETLPEALTAKQ